MTLSDPRIAEIRAQLAAITPGPWKVDRNWHVTAEGHDWQRALAVAGHYSDADLRVCHVFGPGNKNKAAADFAFIASAPSSMEYLLGELDALRAQLDAVKRHVSEHLVTKGCCGWHREKLAAILEGAPAKASVSDAPSAGET